MERNQFVAIVGRPNVGKSTLFNRLSQKSKAIVIDVPGATRDRNYADCSWYGRRYTLIDTGGFEPASTETLLIQMREQTHLAIEEADLVIFLMDGRDGLTPADMEISRLLREAGKTVFYAVNKVDGPRHEGFLPEFYRLGVPRIYDISAQHGLGIDELMDDLAEYLPPAKKTPEEGEQEKEGERIRIALIGKPNVGKSSLLNKILGYERTIANPTPGTTRDAIDTPFTFNGRNYLLIDTAGIRKKSRISLNLEKYSVVQALKTLDRCEIALLLIDAEEGITDQDTKIAGLAFEKGRAVILVVNKWDRIAKDNSTVGRYVKDIQDRLKFMDFAPMIFVSALSGQRVTKIFALVEEVYRQYTARIGTGELNRKVTEIVAQNPPPQYAKKGHPFNYVTQVAVKPPTFAFFVAKPSEIHFSYERFLINSLRNAFGFTEVPIRIVFRKKHRDTDA
ncbi:GTP-binding protein [Syntrophus gentianae]|uniref:GTPase Der n=1 Tax=Syntrophus gentianae TaxID=43775 RepID=A0A1H7YAI0_9BACT|nr:ribosome biogenesis GTPase Der [Syntrophus gentianae]SEM43003.1 GTP-binding protein [Syntrophus gentianae]